MSRGLWAKDRVWQRVPPPLTRNRMHHQGGNRCSQGHLHHPPGPTCSPHYPWRTGSSSASFCAHPSLPPLPSQPEPTFPGQETSPTGVLLAPDTLSSAPLDGEQLSHAHPCSPHVTHTHAPHMHTTHNPCAPLLCIEWKWVTLSMSHKTHPQTPQLASHLFSSGEEGMDAQRHRPRAPQEEWGQ